MERRVAGHAPTGVFLLKRREQNCKGSSQEGTRETDRKGRSKTLTETYGEQEASH